MNKKLTPKRRTRICYHCRRRKAVPRWNYILCNTCGHALTPAIMEAYAEMMNRDLPLRDLQEVEGPARAEDMHSMPAGW